MLVSVATPRQIRPMGEKTPHEAQFDLIPKFVFPIPGDELFFHCSLMRPSSSRSAIVTYFFQDRRRNPARVQTERKSEVRAFFRWSRAPLHIEHILKTGPSPSAFLGNVVDILEGELPEFCGNFHPEFFGNRFRDFDRVKLQLALRMPMSVSLNEGNERMYFYAKDVYCGKCINSA